MILKEKERSVIEDLQTQEKSCVEKYGKYAEQARDPELNVCFTVGSEQKQNIRIRQNDCKNGGRKKWRQNQKKIN